MTLTADFCPCTSNCCFVPCAFKRFIWVWVKIKPPGDKSRFWSMIPFTRIPFWVHILGTIPETGLNMVKGPTLGHFEVC